MPHPSHIECSPTRSQPEQANNGCDRRVAALAAESLGVLSVAELRGCGLDDDAISVRTARGWLHPVHRGVYAVGHLALTLKGRFLAAVKACGGGAVLSHISAGVLWRILEWEERYVEITVAGTSPRRHPGIRAHRTRRLDPADVVQHEGIPVTSPARTLVDLAGVIPHRPLRRAVREALGLQLTTLAELNQAMRRAGRRRGLRNLARIIASGPAPTRSVLEDVVLELILNAGLARPEVNKPLRLDGRTVIPDFRWPAERLIVEADGAAWHEHELAREDDAERQALLEAHGERIVRVTWAQAVSHPARTIARIRAAGAPATTSVVR
jgi:very-short-patch-repair endonuclease